MFSPKNNGFTEGLLKAVREAVAKGPAPRNPAEIEEAKKNAGTTPKTPREKELAAKSGDPNKITKGDVIKARMGEEVEHVDEKYIGFKKLAAKVGPNVAAYIGRKKYGKAKFQAAAAAGKKMNEDVEQTDEALRVMGSTGEGGMKRMAKGRMPGAAEHRTAVAKIAKQIRAKSRIRNVPTNAQGDSTGYSTSEPRVMKYRFGEEIEHVGEGIEDRLEASRAKYNRVARRLGKPEASGEKKAKAASSTRKVQGTSYGGSKQKEVTNMNEACAAREKAMETMAKEDVDLFTDAELEALFGATEE